MAEDFQRARSPAQKARRIARILDAARALLAANPDSAALSLTALARRAGMAKSNVYRYFESREAVLLSLLEAETATWVAEVRAGLSGVDGAAPFDARLDAVARLLAAEAARRPLLCHLLSVLPSVLEHNVSPDTVAAFKRASRAVVETLVVALHGVLPELPLEAHAELMRHASALIVGTWPLSRPAAAVAEAVRAHPELASLVHDLEADLCRAFVLMARGLRDEAELPR
jgi:AcrR family transcriptional regulator